MNIINKLKQWAKEGAFARWGIIGSVFVLCALFIPQIGYSGRQGEAYSLLNHFVSELGELGVSHLAYVFNIGLFIGGIFYLGFMIGLGIYIKHWLAKLAMIIGIVTSLCSSLVGVFPMNYLIPHYTVAMGFFFGALITITLFTITILLQKKQHIPKLFSIAGIFVAVVYTCLLSFTFSGNPSDLSVNFDSRPDIWIFPMLEWAAILSVVGYLLLISLYVHFTETYTD
ncbi:MAG: DUF998 domain-containing protein [Promethearchaeia archaeon]